MALNKITMKNKYPVPNTNEFFNRLGGTRIFSKLDLRSGYYQVRIKAGDEPKTVCIMHYKSYEFTIILFGLTNAPTAFCILIN